MNGWTAARNLLAVRLDNAGDVLMLGPALRSIKETSPTTRLTLLASRAGAAVAPHLPWIDDVIVWRPIWQELGASQDDPTREQQLISMLAERRFDGAIVFTSFRQDPHVAGYVCYLAGIPLRAGQSKEFGGKSLTHELPSLPDELHQTERNLALVQRLGFAVRDRALQFNITEQDRDRADRRMLRFGLRPEESFVVIHPGASASARRYSPRRYSTLVRYLKARGIQLVITGSEREIYLLREIASTDLPILMGASLGEFASVIRRASAVLCGNTLPMHLCDAFGTAVVVLFSGTDLESQWQPRFAPHRLLRRETPCHPCHLIDCPIGQPCLDIDPEMVAQAVIGLLSPPGASSHPMTVASRGGTG